MTDTSFDIAAARQLAEQAKANAATWSKHSRSQSYVSSLVDRLLAACAELEQARAEVERLRPFERVRLNYETRLLPDEIIDALESG